MPSLIFYNCSGARATITLNTIAKPAWTLEVSRATDDYYPYTQKAPRDVSKEHGDPGQWGRINKLRIAWDLLDPLDFRDIRDPSNAIGNVDLLLWIFSDRVVFSQGSLWLGEVAPR